MTIFNINMLNKNISLPRNTIIALGIALVIIVAMIVVARYFIVSDKRAEPKPPAQFAPVATIPEDVLRSLTPPEGAKPIEISKEVLDSLAPPKDANPAEIPQSVFDSLTPPTHR